MVLVYVCHEFVKFIIGHEFVKHRLFLCHKINQKRMIVGTTSPDKQRAVRIALRRLNDNTPCEFRKVSTLVREQPFGVVETTKGAMGRVNVLKRDDEHEFDILMGIESGLVSLRDMWFDITCVVMLRLSDMKEVVIYSDAIHVPGIDVGLNYDGNLLIRRRGQDVYRQSRYENMGYSGDSGINLLDSLESAKVSPSIVNFLPLNDPRDRVGITADAVESCMRRMTTLDESLDNTPLI